MTILPFPLPRSDAVVLIPTYNERDNIAAIIQAVIEAADVDVWILDDASPDGTGVIADEIAAGEPRVQVIHRARKAGIGRAYRDGFAAALAAGYARIVTMDADFSHPPSTLPDLLALSESYDLVLGSRWVHGGGTQGWPLLRQLISRGGSLYARGVLGKPVRDFTGGFKCFRREVLEAIDLARVRCTGYAFQIEMTYRAMRLGFRVKETPIVFVERRRGTSKMSWRIITEAMMRVPQLRLRASLTDPLRRHTKARWERAQT